MVRVRILVRNRPGVFDPVGKVVESGLARLGHDVGDVRVGKTIELTVASTEHAEIRAEVDRMCEEFLVNPVLEEYVVEILTSEA